MFRLFVLLATLLSGLLPSLSYAQTYVLSSKEIINTSGVTCGRIKSVWIPGALKKGKFTPLKNQVKTLKKRIKKANKEQKKGLVKKLKKLQKKLKLRNKICADVGLGVSSVGTPEPVVTATPSIPNTPETGVTAVPTNTPEPTATATTKQVIQELESTGQLPILDRSPELLGTDSNNDGVRDDIESHINNKMGLSEPEKTAALSFAKTLNRLLTIDLNDDLKVQQLASEKSRAMQCIFYRSGDEKADEIVDVLEKISFNTKNRALVYLKYNRARNGSVTRLLLGDTCEK